MLRLVAIRGGSCCSVRKWGIIIKARANIHSTFTMGYVLLNIYLHRLIEDTPPSTPGGRIYSAHYTDEKSEA